jgi:hypothetical protein
MTVARPGAASAQRSFDAEFDSTRQIKLQGQMILFEWTNPRSWIHIDVLDSRTGKHGHWKVEGGPPSALLRHGWTKSTLPGGTVITVMAFRARDGSNRASAASISFPDGRQMSLGNASAEAAIAAAAQRRED